MNDVNESRIVGMLRRVIRDCQKVYLDSAQEIIKRHPTLIQGNPADFQRMMDDLHRGLLVKVYVTMVRADNRWTKPEKMVAAAMIEHLWDQKLMGADLREAATGLFEQADRLSWASLVSPFVRYEPLANARAKVETVVTRLANLVAKCDGQTMPEESEALHELQHQIDTALYPVGAGNRTTENVTGSQATQSEKQQATQSTKTPPPKESIADKKQRLDKAQQELDVLIGLDSVKQRVKSYTNFLRLQQQRLDAGLSTMPISLHMVFVGNPGTGKTTVARIIGQILGAMGTLSSGHVVETDRSGLVAQYAGQTAAKTNKLIDSALGGILFIDEAYSLIDASGDDAYGREAIGTLLKRMEDNRDDLVVILAGYSGEMKEMIESNPGLKSRVNTQIEFEDYAPEDLGEIFESMCESNQYKLSADARHRLLLGFDHLYQTRDRHFGNGRLVRNAFEDTVRRLADRVAEVTELSEDLLTQLTPQDISVSGLKQNELNELLDQSHKLKLKCRGCGRMATIEPTSLGRKIRCSGCDVVQSANWAKVLK